MPSWDKWVNNDEKKSFKKKINKNVFCKRNRQSNGQYGKHVYEQDSRTCKLCGHYRKSIDNAFNNDSIDPKE